MKIIIILKEAQLLKQENNHKLCVSQEDTTAKNRKNIKFAYWSIEQLPFYTKTRRLKSFPWDALVYGSIMAFYLNLEKIRKIRKMCHVMSLDEQVTCMLMTEFIVVSGCKDGVDLVLIYRYVVIFVARFG